MFQTYWSSGTFIFYYFVGIFCAFMIYLQYDSREVSGKKIILFNSAKYKVIHNNYLILIWLILTLFAGLRKVAPGIGGSDAITYDYLFINIGQGIGRFEEIDKGFGVYLRLISYVTQSVIVFRFINYGFIAFCYCYVIKKVTPSNISAIPFILIVWPYLCAFNTLRSSMAIAILLLALVCFYEKRYVIGVLFLIWSVLTHRMMALFIPLFIFYRPLYNIVNNSDKKQLLIIIICSVIVAYLMSRWLQKYVLINNMLSDSTADKNYMSRSMNYNILNSWPMFLQQLLLLIFFYMNYHKYTCEKTRFVLLLSFYDIAITLPGLVLGIWRVSQALYIPTLILWGVLISDYEKNFKKGGQFLIKIIFILAFSFLLYKRIDSIYDTSRIMPYYFFWE